LSHKSGRLTNRCRQQPLCVADLHLIGVTQLWLQARVRCQRLCLSLDVRRRHPLCQMSIRIGIIGDYHADFEPHRATDAALTHAAAALSLPIESAWLPTPSLDVPDAIRSLATFNGLWVAPGSPYQSMSGALRAIRFARESGLPLLGTCGGFQHIILEYARHVLGFSDATDAEYDPDSSKLFISRLACSLVGRTLVISLQPGSLVARTYGATTVTEQYYCNFGVNPDYTNTLSSGDLAIVGSDAEGEVRVVELRSCPFFVGTLFVPQLRSQPKSPHPLILAFLNATQNVHNP
jgi:CTP synthase (UTP-ammonia lyase)